MNPLAGNPLRTREDAQRAVIDLFEPLIPAYVAGGARVSLGATATAYDLATAELEAFARPLFGIVPLVAGGASFDHWDLFREGLARGTDPHDPQYWGAIDGDSQHPDQRMVEVAPIGLALALVPEQIVDPLSPAERQRVLDWLEPINRHPAPPNNWWFFRVLVNLGFARIGGPFDQAAVEESLRTIEGYWLGDGWYRDGVLQNTDFYNAWAFHFYGLIYAVLAAKTDPERSARFRERARRFAVDWEARFDSSGRIIPFGRSLTYRFGGAAYWGALAFAGEEALPWGQLRHLWTQHLRWWTGQPIGRSDGALSIGWSYPNLLMSETYNGPGSPYWSFKAFLPLALGPEHPFWSTPEEAATHEARHVVQQPAAAVVNRDDRQAQMLNGGRGVWFMRQGPAKYGKFAYSSAFGFSLDPDDPLFEDVTDSMLFLRDDDKVRRVRSAVSDSGIDDDVVWSRWQPFPDVEVVTVLCGEAPWHARIHVVRAGRTLETFESGFAIGLDDLQAGSNSTREASGGTARVQTVEATSLIVDATQDPRRADVRDLQPNTNILRPRAAVPLLHGHLDPGTHVLACVVGAVEAPGDIVAGDLPAIPERAWRTLQSLTGNDYQLGTP